MHDFQATLKINKTLINQLKDILIPQNNLVLFIGAGMSIPSGLPSWYSFLLNLINEFVDTNFISREDGDKLISKLNAGHFLDTAQNLFEINDLGLQDAVNQAFKTKDESSITGPIKFLEKLKIRKVITTNYDTLLEKVLNIDPARIFQPRPPARYELNSVLSGNEFLLKLHGTVGNYETMVLTSDQYEKVYSQNVLKDFLVKLFESKHLLFMGCSLAPDRLTDLMAEIRDENPHGINAYAIYAEDPDNKKNIEKTKHLSRIGVRPIWLKNPREKNIGKVYAEQLLPLILHLANDYIDPLTEEIQFIRENAGLIFRREALKAHSIDPKRMNLNQPLEDIQIQAIYDAGENEKWIIEVFEVHDLEVAHKRMDHILSLLQNQDSKVQYRYMLILFSVIHPDKNSLDAQKEKDFVKDFKDRVLSYYESGFLSIKGPFLLPKSEIQSLFEKYQGIR